jgi:hypothetical protein
MHGSRRRPARRRRLAGLAAAGAVALVGVTYLVAAGHGPAAGPGRATSGRRTYADLAAQATRTLEQRYYAGAGKWNVCLPRICGTGNLDWGTDSLTYALYLHWTITGDRRVPAMMNALTGTAYNYSPAVYSSSDVPAWDAIADVREYQVTGNPTAIAKAEAAFRYLAVDKASSFERGACPSIDYQLPGGLPTMLKTLESGSNFVKAALLLYQVTKYHGYLKAAESQYAAIRRYYLSPGVPLYTVYVFDNGKVCSQAPARYFGSVNGNMIWAGYDLARLTGRNAYLDQAIATAKAVQQHLGDATGVYADLQAENDVSEPLIEAMFDLARFSHQAFARDWLLRAASAAGSDVNASGAYGRFFDGPPPRAPATDWQVNGGLTLAVAAGALDPRGRPAAPGFWTHAVFVHHDLRLIAVPVRFTFTGRAVAIIGTIGEHCCESGHARVYIDGTQTFDQTGIWQNKSSSSKSLPGTVLFAWRWPAPGTHTIEIRAGIGNTKEGTAFFHMNGYYLVR